MIARRTKHAASPQESVAQQFRSYAQRGVFAEFSEKVLPRGKIEFRFLWLTPRSIHAVFDGKTSVLRLIDLLPDIPPRSTMDRALREFIRARRNDEVPAHRRLSASLIPSVRCTNQNASISLALSFNPKMPAEATRAAVNLISEIFQNFLAGPYHDYMVMNFGVPEE